MGTPAPPSGGGFNPGPPVPTSTNRPELSGGSPLRPPSGETTCDPAIRDRVIKEIIDTEEDYIRDLEVIINVYLVAMRDQSIGTKDQINNVFSNVEMIYKINKGIFLPVLKTASVGKAFLTVVDYLKLYMVYCGNQDLSMQTLAALKANPKIEQFLYQCSRKPECRSLDLASFLIKPIQRICKYPLLLRELLKQTPEDQPDYTNLTTALQRMTTTVGTINEKKSDLDKKMRLYELSHKINLKGDMHLLNSPNRRLISEGELTRVAPKEVLGKKLLLKTQGHYFLFSDLFLFTKPTSSSYDLRAQVPLTQALYKDSDIAEDSFELTQIGQKRVFFAAPSAAKKAEMKKELEEVIASFLDVRYKKFVQKEIAKTLAMQVKPVNPDVPMPAEPTLPEDFSVLSFDDWKHKLEAKPLPTPPPQDDSVRFVCNSPAPESEKRVIKLTSDNVTLPALQDQIRKKFDIGPAVGFRIVYPNNDGSWEMCPLNDQRELDQCLEKKISDLFLTWLA